MFNLFKRRNKLKELETRILALESNVITLNSQEKNKKSQSHELILTIDGEVIGKVAMDALKKMQRLADTKLV